MHHGVCIVGHVSEAVEGGFPLHAFSQHFADSLKSLGYAIRRHTNCRRNRRRFKIALVTQLAQFAGLVTERLYTFLQVIQHTDVARLEVGERLPDPINGLRLEDKPIAALPAEIETYLVAQYRSPMP